MLIFCYIAAMFIQKQKKNATKSKMYHKFLKNFKE